jgi:hypothetical protein
MLLPLFFDLIETMQPVKVQLQAEAEAQCMMPVPFHPAGVEAVALALLLLVRLNGFELARVAFERSDMMEADVHVPQ